MTSKQYSQERIKNCQLKVSWKRKEKIYMLSMRFEFILPCDRELLKIECKQISACFCFCLDIFQCTYNNLIEPITFNSFLIVYFVIQNDYT